MKTDAVGVIESQQHELIVRSLRERLGTNADANEIAAAVDFAFAAYSAARITQFVPILVESRVWSRLCSHRSARDREYG